MHYLIDSGKEEIMSTNPKNKTEALAAAKRVVGANTKVPTDKYIFSDTIRAVLSGYDSICADNNLTGRDPDEVIRAREHIK